jgi:probable HAF family extracellular repeat protein
MPLKTTLFALAAIVSVLLSRRAAADPVYSVRDLGSAHITASTLPEFTAGTPTYPVGNYLPLLGPTQQASFQAGSFDVYAHPATFAAGGLTFYVESVGDIVQTNTLTDPETITSPLLVTSNNHGINAGTGNEVNSAYPGVAGVLTIFTPDPHSVVAPYPPYQTVQSPGYLSTASTNSSETDGRFYGSVAAINDSRTLAFTEYTYAQGSWTANPHIMTVAHGDVVLGNLGGANGGASALNNSNQVVGWSQIVSGAEHAFLYSNGTMQDLNLMIPPLSGITLVNAVGIDAQGDIVAYGTNSSGQMDEYLLTPLESPVPEPSALAVFALVIAALVARRVRAKHGAH